MACQGQTLYLIDTFVSYEKMKFCEYRPWSYIQNTLLSLELMKEENKLDCCITLGRNGLPCTNTQPNWDHL